MKRDRLEQGQALWEVLLTGEKSIKEQRGTSQPSALTASQMSIPWRNVNSVRRSDTQLSWLCPRRYLGTFATGVILTDAAEGTSFLSTRARDFCYRDLIRIYLRAVYTGVPLLTLPQVTDSMFGQTESSV